MKIIVNARALDRAQGVARGGKLLYRVEAVTGMLTGDALMDTDVLPEPLASEFREWMNADSNGWRPIPVPQPTTQKGQPTAAPIEIAPDPIIERMHREIALQPQTEKRRQADQKQAEDRLTWYQIEQGLVDDRHNATLIAEWVGENRGYATAGAIDQAIHELRPQLHWKQLSAFTKRLAALGKPKEMT